VLQKQQNQNIKYPPFIFKTEATIDFYFQRSVTPDTRS